MSDAGRFITLLLASALSVLLAVAVFVWTIDPYGYFHLWSIARISERKPLALYHDRILKAAASSRRSFNCVTAGSSRMGEGIPLDHRLFSGCTGIYDLSLAGTTMGETAALLEKALRHHRLRRVVLGLDLFMFNATRLPARGSSTDLYQDSRLAGVRVAARQLFNLSAAQDAWTTLRTQGEPAFHLTNGTTSNAFLEAQRGAQPTRGWFMRCERGYIFHQLPEPNYRFARFENDRRPWETLSRLLRELHATGTYTILLIPPAHVWDSELIDALGLWREWEYFKRSIVMINETEAKRSGKLTFPVWDFADYSPRMTARLPSDPTSTAAVEGYWDCSHFTRALGRQVLDRIDGGGDADFGELLTSDRIEAWLAEVRRRATLYRKSQPRDARDVRRVVACYAPPTLLRRVSKIPGASDCISLTRATR